MNRVDAMVLAMAAAAAANFRPNDFAQKRPEVKAYLELRRLLADKYPAVSNDILNIGPASIERRNMLKRQLQEADADTDTSVLQHVIQLLRLLLEHTPNAATAVFAAPADLEDAITTLSNYLEEMKREQRNHTRYPHPAPNAATSAYL